MSGVSFRVGCVLLFFCGFAFSATPIRYTVTLVNADKHLVHVAIDVPAGKSERELQLPVWNALYQVRDFSQNMNWIKAANSTGDTLTVLELNKSRWKITGASKGARVQYEMFSNNPGPFGAGFNPQHAFFNFAEILCYIEGERAAPVSVEFRDIPAGWKIATSLRQYGNAYSAPNYDQLVDSPVEISNFGERDFAAAGGNYRVVVDDRSAAAILDKIVPAIKKIVSTETEWMNDRPFETYTFIYHFPESAGGGGMEHAYGTAITLRASYVNEDFDRFEGITAHEFFHLWNVKRIRPQSLEPIDYTKENYTPSLWFSEGVDSTVAGYIELRAGLLDERGYLKHLSEELTELEARPARLSQSAEQSSIDAWLEKYPYYNSPARSISYYNKGELLGVLLDLKMREATNDRVSLRDLFQWLNVNYAKKGKFFHDSEGIREAVETLCHADFGDFFQKYVSGVDEIPWDSFFHHVGLRVSQSELSFADPGFVATRAFDQPLVIAEVESGSNADHAGLRVGDVIKELNGQHGSRDLQTILAKLAPGTDLHLVVERGPIERELHWTLASRKQNVFRLEDLPEITPEQKSNREAWLFDRGARLSPH